MWCDDILSICVASRRSRDLQLFSARNNKAKYLSSLFAQRAQRTIFASPYTHTLHTNNNNKLFVFIVYTKLRQTISGTVCVSFDKRQDGVRMSRSRRFLFFLCANANTGTIHELNWTTEPTNRLLRGSTNETNNKLQQPAWCMRNKGH